jgi:hypothetical protein
MLRALQRDIADAVGDACTEWACPDARRLTGSMVEYSAKAIRKHYRRGAVDSRSNQVR